MITLNKDFISAVTMTIHQELEAFPDKTTDSWLPLAEAVAVGDRGRCEKNLYSFPKPMRKKFIFFYPLALERYHLEGNEDRQGYSPAHMLCMRGYPSLSLVRYLVTKMSRRLVKAAVIIMTILFCTVCTHFLQLENVVKVLTYCRFC